MPLLLDIGMTAQAFDWSKEINQVVTKSLVTTFGLDFLLFEDKKGGDVDTIHNVRQGVWATEQEKQNYESRGEYKPFQLDEYGNKVLDNNGKAKRVDVYRNNVYKKRGALDAEKKENLQLDDLYRNTKMKLNEDRQLDHVISASKIHDDAGRVLAGKDGIELANKDINLVSTHRYINNIKSNHSPEEFFNNIVPKKIIQQKEVLNEKLQKLDTLPIDTPAQRDTKRRLENEISDHQKNISVLENIDKETSSKVVENATNEYEKQINSYYTSSKFFTASLSAAGVAGIKMGLRESLGLVFAEIWFELKEQIPNIYAKYKKIEFKILDFLNELKETLLNIIERVKARCKELLLSFGTGTISGIFSSITTTILNIFLTTTKTWGKMIRETWLNIVNIVKLVFFNPENLSTGQLAKATFKILSASIGAVTGMLIHENLVVLETLPFLSAEIRGFLTALATGIITLGLNYFIEQSPVMVKFWAYLDQFKTKYERTSDHFKEINAELDRYVLELTQLEFGINVNELAQFAYDLEMANTEFERNIILKKEVELKNIELPFEMGNTESTKSWLLGLVK